MRNVIRVLVFLAYLLALAAGFVLFAQPPAKADPRDPVAGIVAKILRADYGDDRPALRQLHAELFPYTAQIFDTTFVSRVLPRRPGPRLRAEGNPADGFLKARPWGAAVESCNPRGLPGRLSAGRSGSSSPGKNACRPAKKGLLRGVAGAGVGARCDFCCSS